MAGENSEDITRAPERSVSSFRKQASSLRARLGARFSRQILNQAARPTEDQLALPVEMATRKKVTDEHRVLSKSPVEAFLYERAPAVFTLERTGEEPEIKKAFELADGKRLIITGIPYLDIQTGEETADRTVQIYHNQEGFLVADKVVDEEIARKGSLVIAPNDKGQLEVVGESHALKRNSDFLHNYEKQEFSPGSGIQLLTTTYKIPHGGGSYSSIEIAVMTPDDTGNTVQVAFIGYAGKLPSPIVVKEIADIT